MARSERFARTRFAAGVVGSLPRPLMVREMLPDQPGPASAEAARSPQMDAAVRYAIAVQEQAGLDLVSDGEWRRHAYTHVMRAATIRSSRRCARSTSTSTSWSSASPWPGTSPSWGGCPEDRLIGLGAVECRFEKIDTTGQIAGRVEEAIKHVDPGRLSLNPDCGFAPGLAIDMPLEEPYLKLKNEAEAAALLRERYPA